MTGMTDPFKGKEWEGMLYNGIKVECAPIEVSKPTINIVTDGDKMTITMRYHTAIPEPGQVQMSVGIAEELGGWE